MPTNCFVALGDIHLDDLIWRRHREIAGDARLAFRSFLDHAIRLQVPAVLDGDIFDSTDPDSSLVRFFREEMNRMREAGIPVYALQGNHDKRNDVPWYIACSPHPIHIGDGKPVTINGVRCVGFDYAVRDVIEKQLADLRERIDGGEAPPEVLFLHQAVRQALRFEGAHNCDLDWIHPLIPLAILGDIHRPCEMPTPGGRAFYTGGAHPRSLEELGPKSCLNVTVEPGKPAEVLQLPLAGRSFAKVVWTPDDEIDPENVIQNARAGHLQCESLRPVVWMRYSPEKSVAAHELITRLRVEKAIVVDDPMVQRTKQEVEAAKVDTSDLPKLPDLLARILDPQAERFAFQMTLALMDPTTNPVDLIRDERDRFLANYGKPS